LLAFANDDDRENKTKDVEQEENRQFNTHLNKVDNAILMKLLRRNGEQGKMLLKLEEALIKTKELLKKMANDHEELKCSHGDSAQWYRSI
jgi:Mg2+ and Co2+ transporter CorA